MRIIKGNQPGARRPPSQSRGEAAVRAAIEKEYARYIPLKCGHYVTREADLAYSVWRPKGRPIKHFCETCGKWVQGKPKVKPVQGNQQEPLF